MTRASTRIGRRIIAGLREAVAYERGELPGVRATWVSITARVAEVAPPPRYTPARVARLRAALGLSQSVFARALNVSPETVRSWEQGKRCPNGAVLRLLQVAERHPEVILESVTRRSA
jgi:putative transcriptional regulator